MNYALSKKDKWYLLILAITGVLALCHTIMFTLNNFGIFCSDIYLYLANSVYFSGVSSIRGIQLFLGTIVCLLTSILMRFGIDGVISIYIISGAIAILGNLGLYLLLRTRFSELLSFAGAIIYSGLSLYCLWFATGHSDLPAVSFTIWCVYFTILAINKDSKYYIPAILFLVLGFLTRYTAGLIVPVLLMYFIYKTRFKIDKKTKKYFGICLILITAIAAICIILSNLKSNHFIIDKFIATLVGEKGISGDPFYNTGKLYYLKNLLVYTSSYTAFFNVGDNFHLMNPTPLSYGLITILVVGIALCYDKLKQIKITNKKLAILTILLFILTIGSAFIAINVISIILMLLTLLLARETLKDSEFKYLDLNLLMMGWLMSNLIFFSYYPIKMNRYILPVLPAFVYFVICAVNKIEEKVDKKIKIKNIIPLVLIILFLINGFCYVTTIDNHLTFHAEEEASHLLLEYDSDLSNDTIGCSYPRAFIYYLEHGVKQINDEDVDSSGVTYYLSFGEPQIHFENYVEIGSTNNIHILKNVSKKRV